MVVTALCRCRDAGDEDVGGRILTLVTQMWHQHITSPTTVTNIDVAGSYFDQVFPNDTNQNRNHWERVYIRTQKPDLNRFLNLQIDFDFNLVCFMQTSLVFLFFSQLNLFLRFWFIHFWSISNNHSDRGRWIIGE